MKYTTNTYRYFTPRRIDRSRRSDRRNAWTLSIAIDQVSKYLGVVYQEDGSWQAHRAKAQRCKQPMGTGGHSAVMQQSADKGQTQT
jgi:hypothetical protein